MTEALAQAAQIFSPAVVRQLGDIEKAFGGRDKVISILACAPKSAELDYLLNLLADEGSQDHNRLRIADLCVAANIRPSELLHHLSAGNLLYARTLAVASLPDHLPQTVEDLLKVSHVYEGECNTCYGKGQVPTRGTDGKVSPDEFDACMACNSTGKRMYQPTAEARNKALEIGGLTEKKGFQVNLGVQQLVQTGSGGGALERVQAAAAVILRDNDDSYVPTAAREAEVE